MTLRATNRFGCVTLAALVLCAGPAFAQNVPSQTQRQVAQTCMPDIRAHCSTVERGGGRLVACLQENSERLSPSCRQALNSLPR
ncbi:MAG: hypothetical protein EAZ99_13125 [Alphaproteobacteria bacterium]|nr:MAG: hypothetical protein EAZ99_13125 [Alphaproteobacteria bacterium]